MMEAIRSYLTAVVAVSMIAVLASALAHGSRMERVVRFAAGLLALLVCVTPLLRLDARTLTDVLEQAERALDYDASERTGRGRTCSATSSGRTRSGPLKSRRRRWACSSGPTSR